jgi:hypothetical protein
MRTVNRARIDSLHFAALSRYCMVRSHGRDREMNLLKRLFNSIGYVFRTDIAENQRQIERLKGRIEDLSQQMHSIEIMSAAVAVELSGPGPFRLPLISQLKSLITEVEDILVAEFESHDGKIIYAMLSPLIAAQVVNDYIAAPTKALLDSSTPIDLQSSAGAFRLPVFSQYNGHFCPGSGLQALVFSSQDSRVFLTFACEIYEKLLRQFEAALFLNEHPNSETPVRYPVRRLPV